MNEITHMHDLEIIKKDGRVLIKKCKICNQRFITRINAAEKVRISTKIKELFKK